MNHFLLSDNTWNIVTNMDNFGKNLFQLVILYHSARIKREKGIDWGKNIIINGNEEFANDHAISA